MYTPTLRYAATLATILLAGGVATAQVDNDACVDATLVGDGAPAIEGDNTLASGVDDAEASCQGSDHDVWFEYVATCNGAATVDTFGSGQSDTVLSAYDACGGNEIACNDDTGGLLSQVTFATTASQSYWIRLASFDAPGDYDLNITCTGTPANDDCASASIVTDGVPAAEGNNSQASGTDDDEASCQYSNFDVWFQYTPTCIGTVIVDTFGSGQSDTVLSVYGGCGGGEIACNDDSGGLLSQVSFDPGGATVVIRLASFGLPGDYDLNITCIGVPVNDTCATATAVVEGVPAAEGNNSQASATDDDEASCQGSDSDVWFEYTALVPGTLTVDTFGSGQSDTVLSVYDACGGNEIVCNDDTGGLLSQVSFAVAVDETYWIRLASFGTPGDYDLNITLTEAPINDDCASATVVTNGAPAAEGDNSQAGDTDDDEASCQEYSDKDVWFLYWSTCTGAATVDTFGSGQSDTVLSVYDACGGSEIACNDDTGGSLSQVTFATVTGNAYWIRLASFGAPGDYDLNITCTSAPANDACSSATFVIDGTPAIEGDNSQASATDDGEASCQSSDFDVWFLYGSNCTGAATVDTFGSGQSDTVLSVYDACGGSEIACNDDSGGSLSQVTFATVTGNAYWIRLASLGAPGDYDLNITCTSGPPNDDCSSATAVTEGIPAAEGDNSQASGTDDDEASCQFSDFDVWFTYLAVCDGPVTVDTFGSGQVDTVLSVYEGCGGTEVACNDDTNGSLSQVTFDAAEAMEYKIRLGSFGAPGDYDVNITLADCNGNGIADACDLTGLGRFEDFEGGAAPTYTTNNTAIVDAGSVRLTEALGSQIGSVVFEPVSPDPVSSFTASFDFRIGPSTGSGADGLSFALLDASVYDTSALFGEDGPGADSLAVSFDTYDNGPPDPSGNFVEVFYNGASLATGVPSFNMEDAQWHHADITFDGSSLTLVLTPNGGLPETPLSAVAVPGFTPFESLYGFGARTGGVDNEHRIDNVQFVDTTTTNDCDSNGVPDECDPDADGDGMIDECDLCPTTSSEIDDCANALLIGEGAFDFCNEDATLDGPVDCGGTDMSRDIWFRYVAPTTGLVTIDTCAEEDFNTILAVYTGTCGALTLEGCSDDDCPLSLMSRIANLPLAASDEILIRVGAYAPDMGVGILTVDFCLDDDGDGVCNEDDVCPGFDDNGPDADGDGMPDVCDVCPGFDDFVDTDDDGVPDGCDLCPNDPNPTITILDTSVAYTTLQFAVSAGVSGQTIQIGAGTLCEDNIIFPNGVDLTIQGAGRELTIIDGGGAASPDYPIIAMFNSGQTSATVISDLTLRNGRYSTIATGGGALVIAGNPSPVFRNVNFLDNSGFAGGGGAHISLNGASAIPVFDRCVFAGGFDAWAALELHDTQAMFFQCLLADNVGTGRALEYVTNGVGTVVNCTIVQDPAVTVRAGTTINITNSVLDGAIQFLGGGVVNTYRCLYAGATGDNIDGTPTFVDAPGADYRLAPGSLGIDAADYDAYTSAGGGATDLTGDDRLFDDICTDDTGSGAFTYLDVGAYEFQGGIDSDGDGVPDSCDVCPGFDDNVDADGDGVPDDCDNCPDHANGPVQAGVPGVGNQTDSDGDGIGDACDAEVPEDGSHPHDRRKNRYITFDPNNASNDGSNIAFKVEIKQIALGSCGGTTGGPTDFCREDRGANDCNACSAVGNTCINLPIDCAPMPPQTCDPTGETCVNDAPDVGGTNAGRVWWVGPESPLGNSVHLMVSEPFRKVSTDWPVPTHVAIARLSLKRSTESGQSTCIATSSPMSC